MSNTVFNMKTDVENPKIGVEGKNQLAANVVACVADSYLLMVKTQAYHWNAVGPLFHSLHLLTEEQYNNLFKAIDEMAERVRSLGYPAPYSITDMISHSEISENVGNPTTEQMITNLINDHEIAARRFRQSVARAEDAADVVTADMLTARMAFHEKAIWMLSALLAK